MGSVLNNERRFRRGRLVAVVTAAVTASVLSVIPAPASAAPASASAPAPAATPEITEGAVFIPVLPCRVADTREAGGPVGIGAVREFQISGTGAGFAAQGGKADGCAIPEAATAVSASITAVDPTGDGFFRAWPSGGPAATATFLNFTKNKGITNTGAIALGTGTKDLTTRNYKAVSDYVIDVQGYFVDPADVPVDAAGSVFVPVIPCRVVDTREVGGPLSNGEVRPFQIAGTGAGFAAQGGKADGCAIPDDATGVSASVSAVDPQGDGFFRAWPTGGPAATATFLNFTKAQSNTNTGAFGLGTGTQDLTTRNFGAKSEYVIDVQGYFVALENLAVDAVGSTFVAMLPCRVADTREGGGPMGNGTVRPFQITGSGPGFTLQGGKGDGCAIPGTAAAVEASVSAVDPQGNGFFRAWPTGGPAATATFLNYNKAQSVTNTGAIGLGTTTEDMTTRNFGAITEYVIDIQGYFVELTTPVDPPAEIKADIAAGETSTCYLDPDGTVKCWGKNNYGQLGNGVSGPTAESATPVTVTGITSAIAMGSGGDHACAVLDDGTIKCWGGGDNGQLGDGNKANRSTPVDVEGITNAVDVSAVGDHSCALLEDGGVECWGYGNWGQLGNGGNSDSAAPVTVSGINNAVSIANGEGQSCALLDDGSIKCWGGGVNGQLGNGAWADTNTPVTVSGINNAVSVDTGAYHSCAVLDDGTVNCWGRNNDGALGDGTTDDSNTPVAVTGITNATSVTTGNYHSCATLEDGAANCWGINFNGQLGNDDNTNSSTPVAVSGLTDVVTISAGYEHTCAIEADDTVSCWGANWNGRLGDGTTTNSKTPVTVIGLLTGAGI